MKLVNFKMPPELIAELEEARAALGRRGVAELVREAVRRFLDDNEQAIRAHRRWKRRAVAQRS